jgi:hypothetical protein
MSISYPDQPVSTRSHRPLTPLRPLRQLQWTSAALLALLAGTSGCFDRPVTDPPLGNSGEIPVALPIAVNRNLDILFVIDDSESMKNEQDALAEKFQLLMQQIVSAEYGTPNVHIGVVSTNMGGLNVLGNEIDGCEGDGAGGRLQNAPRPQDGETEATCAGPTGRYIVDEAGEGSDRVTNYPGTLEAAFACIARLGTNGCGLEQQLEAMRRALDGSVPENQGFLRPDARLAVVFVTDEDDCSVKAGGEAFLDLGRADIGGRSDHRCFTHGVVCDGSAPLGEGSFEDCVPAADSEYLEDVNEYVDFLRGLKKYPDRDILVAGIVGENAEPIVVGPNPDVEGDFKVKQSCFSGPDDLEGAFPPVRLRAFFEAFAFQRQESICSDLGDALTNIGEFIGPPPEGACVPSSLVDRDPASAGLQADCKVSEVRDPDTADERETLISLCDDTANPAASSVLPCYTLTERPDECSVEAPFWVDVFYPADAVVPEGTELLVRCLSR